MVLMRIPKEKEYVASLVFLKVKHESIGEFNINHRYCLESLAEESNGVFKVTKNMMDAIEAEREERYIPRALEEGDELKLQWAYYMWKSRGFTLSPEVFLKRGRPTEIDIVESYRIKD